jgi:hypothetical protein
MSLLSEIVAERVLNQTEAFWSQATGVGSGIL